MNMTAPLAGLACPVCDEPMRYFGTAHYYLLDTRRIATPLFHCRRCDALCRPVDNQELRQHYDRCSYTDPKLEYQFRQQRSDFFRFLITFAMGIMGRQPTTCLDFGCSYGHLLMLLREKGCAVYGVEVCQQARVVCRMHGLDVYSDLDEIDSTRKLDWITLIDSLYYVPDPQCLLRRLRGRLADNGVLLIRVANRNWLLRLLKKIGNREHFGSWLGDAVVGYSNATLETLLQRTGYRILSTCYWEHGKHHEDWGHKLFYWLGSAVSCASAGSLIVSPGIIVLAAKQA